MTLYSIPGLMAVEGYIHEVIIHSSINDVAVGNNSLIKATLVIQSRQHVLSVRIGLHQLLVSITTFVFESLLSSYSP